MKREVRIYNVLFPIWLLWLFPQVLIFVLPGNLLIDCLVLTLTLMALKHREKRLVVKQLWWKFWLFGFLADLVGAALLLPAAFLPGVCSDAEWVYDVMGAVMLNPFRDIRALLWVLLAVGISGVCIYLFDKRAMKACVLLTQREKHVVALAMAAVTAPWMFLIPLYLS